MKKKSKSPQNPTNKKYLFIYCLHIRDREGNMEGYISGC